MLEKSFIGRKVSLLSGLTRLSELDRLIFPQGGRELPERELLRDLEGRITGRAVKQILTLLGSFKKPPELLVRLLRVYEYGDLKSALSALAGGERRAPAFTDISPFGVVNFRAYPDFPAMLRGTEFEFLLEKNLGALGPGEAILLETELDRRYYAALWKALYALAPRDRGAAERILSEELSLRNVLWALRLRTYYEMPPEEVRSQLMDGGGGRRRGRGAASLSADAAESLGFALDNRQDWEGWGREKFLNPPDGTGAWKADPRYFQNAAADHLYRLARRAFHRNPSSLDTVFCFIKLKQYEEDILTSVAEGIGLGMTGGDVFSLLEAKP
jgi:vacuolar-type H+-ATPase subunit C/Vma6